jgi:hypothetical protein
MTNTSMQQSQRIEPLIVSSALAATVAIGYTLCAVAWIIWNEAALQFVNMLFHGLDFRKILVPQGEYGLRLFLYPLVVLTVWAFFIGTLYAVMSNFLHRRFSIAR